MRHNVDTLAFQQDEGFLPVLSGIDDAEHLKAFNSKTARIAGPIGSLAGIGYAVNKKKGFWGTVGYMFLGGVIGKTAGKVIYEIF